ncbi:hypothetical protein CEP53_004806 [Fusarium sp. AF-6]|nr:hypothetical protein CEP53_004806 [Fusarium sp. AF-6]
MGSIGLDRYAIPFEIEPGWPNLPYLINTDYNHTVKAATKVYNGHSYACSNAREGDLVVEMTHQRTVDDLNLLPISTARSAAFFNWRLSDQANAPFYEAYFGALAAAGGDHIVASDDGTDPYAQYIIYRQGKPFKLVFVNTDYYSGSDSRSKTTFTATGLRNGNVKAIRMTTPSSETKIPLEQTDPSIEPRIGGQTFANDDCRLRGTRMMGALGVQEGGLRVTIGTSGALVIYL